MNAVKLGKFTIIVIRQISHKFLLGLLAQILRINNKQNPFRVRVFQKPVNKRDRRKSLPRTRRHLNQRSRMIFSKRFIEIGNRLDLTITHPLNRQNRKFLKTIPQSIFLLHPFPKSFRFVKRKNRTRTRFLITVIGKARQFSGAFINKRQRIIIEIFELRLRVFG